VFKKKVFEYKGRKIRRGADLSGADLSGLAGHDIVATLGSLKNLNFANANLTGANFDGLELERVVFAGANLTGASFSKCWFPQARPGLPQAQPGFEGATLTSATITAAQDRWWTAEQVVAKHPEWFISFPEQSWTSFKGANLDGATLAGHMTKFLFENASLNGATLAGTMLNCSFKNASLKGARFSDARIRLTDFDGADLSGSHFEGDHFAADPMKRACWFSECGFAGAKLLDVTGSAYFPGTKEPLPEITVADGRFFIPLLLIPLKSWSLYEIFKGPPLILGTSWFVALTPQGFIRKPAINESKSAGVESKLAELKELLSQGLIDQAEHDALRRKILGI
jgi:uncharacterized protein YjbI with pentapeptide repeats